MPIIQEFVLNPLVHIDEVSGYNVHFLKPLSHLYLSGIVSCTEHVLFLLLFNSLVRCYLNSLPVSENKNMVGSALFHI